MAVWLVFRVVVTAFFEDVSVVEAETGAGAVMKPTTPSPAPVGSTQDTTSPENDVPPEVDNSVRQRAVIAMVCSSCSASGKQTSPSSRSAYLARRPSFVAGNLIALGGACKTGHPLG